jgi:hypothetical protein
MSSTSTAYREVEMRTWRNVVVGVDGLRAVNARWPGLPRRQGDQEAKLTVLTAWAAPAMSTDLAAPVSRVRGEQSQ